MNGRTAKLLRKVAAGTGRRGRVLKQRWLETPRDHRWDIRRGMIYALNKEILTNKPVDPADPRYAELQGEQDND